MRFNLLKMAIISFKINYWSKNNIHGIVFKTVDLFETTRNWQETLFNFKDSMAQIVLKRPPSEKAHWKVTHLRQAVCIASSFGNNRFSCVSTDRVTTSSKNPEKEEKLVGILNVEPARLLSKPHVNIIRTVQILLISQSCSERKTGMHEY